MSKRSIRRRQTASPSDGSNRTHELIQRRAYEIFLSRDARAGSDLDDWLLAEQELLGSKAVTQAETPPRSGV